MKASLKNFGFKRKGGKWDAAPGIELFRSMTIRTKRAVK